MFKFLGWPQRSDKSAARANNNGGVNSAVENLKRTGGEAKLGANEEEEERENPEEEKLVKQNNDRSERYTYQSNMAIIACDTI